MAVEQIARGEPALLPAPMSPPVAVTPAVGTPGSAPSMVPSSRHLADSVVCASAEAMQVSPHVMRPALVAGLERMFAVGMSAADLLQAMKEEPPSPAADGSAKRGRRGGGAGGR